MCVSQLFLLTCQPWQYDHCWLTTFIIGHVIFLITPIQTQVPSIRELQCLSEKMAYSLYEVSKLRQDIPGHWDGRSTLNEHSANRLYVRLKGPKRRPILLVQDGTVSFQKRPGFLIGCNDPMRPYRPDKIVSGVEGEQHHQQSYRPGHGLFELASKLALF